MSVEKEKRVPWNKGKHTLPQTREKIRQANMGKKLSEETKHKISASCRGRVMDEESKQKIAKAHQGTTHTEETKAKISQSRKGKNMGVQHWTHNQPISSETRRKLSEANLGANSPVSKPVYAFDLYGHLIKSYVNRVAVAEDGVAPSKVSALCCFNDRQNKVTKQFQGIVYSGNISYKIAPTITTMRTRSGQND